MKISKNLKYDNFQKWFIKAVNIIILNYIIKYSTVIFVNNSFVISFLKCHIINENQKKFKTSQFPEMLYKNSNIKYIYIKYLSVIFINNSGMISFIEMLYNK